MNTGGIYAESYVYFHDDCGLTLSWNMQGAQVFRDFDGLYSQVGRPSIAPERLLRALLLQVFYSVRSERQLMEQLNYSLLFRWSWAASNQITDPAAQTSAHLGAVKDK